MDIAGNWNFVPRTNARRAILFIAVLATSHLPAKGADPAEPAASPPASATDAHALRIRLADFLSRQGMQDEVLQYLRPETGIADTWEASFLKNRAVGRRIVQDWEVTKLRGRVLATAFSPDGKLVAASGSGTMIFIVRSDTGEMVKMLHKPVEWVRQIKFSPDGSLLATASDDGYVRYWNISIGRQVGNLPKQYSAILDFEFSPDGKTIATAENNGNVKVWSREAERTPIYTLGPHETGAGAVAFSPPGDRLASASLKGDVYVWDMANGSQVRHFGNHRSVESVALAFSRDGKQLACGYSGAAEIWDVDAATKLMTLGRSAGGRAEVEYLPGRDVLVTATERTINLWDPKNGQPLLRLFGTRDENHALAVSPDGSQLAVGGTGRIRQYAVGMGDAFVELGRVKGRVTFLSFTRDGRGLIAGGNADATNWNIETGEERAENQNAERLLAVGRDETWMAWEGRNHEIIIRDRETRAVRKTLLQNKKMVLSAVSGSSPNRFLSGGWDKRLRYWNLSTGEALWDVSPLPGQVLSLDTSKTGHYAAAAVADNYVGVYEMQDGKELQHIDLRASCVAFGIGGMLAVAGDDLILRLYHATKGELVAEMTGHEDRIAALCFSADGTRIASGSADGTVRIWDVAQGRELMALDLGQTSILAVKFSANGRYLAAGDAKGSVYLWAKDRIWVPARKAWIPASELRSR